MSDLTDKMVAAAATAIERDGDGYWRSAEVAVAAALRAIPEGAYLTWPIPMGITLECWTERTVTGLADEIEASS